MFHYGCYFQCISNMVFHEIGMVNLIRLHVLNQYCTIKAKILLKPTNRFNLKKNDKILKTKKTKFNAEIQ